MRISIRLSPEVGFQMRLRNEDGHVLTLTRKDWILHGVWEPHHPSRTSRSLESLSRDDSSDYSNTILGTAMVGVASA
jgi:hypothetical protein